MREYDINKKLVSNIEMSDEMKQELITNVKNGKRTSDKRFRYSSALMVLLIFLTRTVLKICRRKSR